jgi:hypothetical protein
VLGASARCSPYATILFSLDVNTMKVRRLDKRMASLESRAGVSMVGGGRAAGGNGGNGI